MVDSNKVTEIVYTYTDAWEYAETNERQFTRLPIDTDINTHSFNELDQVLQELIQDAIQDNGSSGVACTQAQWNTIKALLDKSLYISYNGFSMIKASTNGIETYCFGLTDGNYGASLSFNFIISSGLLFAVYFEI